MKYQKYTDLQKEIKRLKGKIEKLQVGLKSIAYDTSYDNTNKIWCQGCHSQQVRRTNDWPTTDDIIHDPDCWVMELLKKEL